MRSPTIFCHLHYYTVFFFLLTIPHVRTMVHICSIVSYAQLICTRISRSFGSAVFFIFVRRLFPVEIEVERRWAVVHNQKVLWVIYLSFSSFSRILSLFADHVETVITLLQFQGRLYFLVCTIFEQHRQISHCFAIALVSCCGHSSSTLHFERLLKQGTKR